MAEYMVCATVGARRSQRAVVVAGSNDDAVEFARAYWRLHGEVLGEVWFVKVLPRGSIFARAACREEQPAVATVPVACAS
jgi:hypothetical protein